MHSIVGKHHPWSGSRVEIPPEIPSMISSEEKSYLYWLTRVLWNGSGDVVEVGPWLGGSTWCLASGMEDNPRSGPQAKLHVIDNFRWQPFMSERAPLRLERDQSFRPHFERNLEPKRHLLAVHEATLPDDDSAALAVSGGVRTGDSSLPIFAAEQVDREVSILFVDGAKSWRGFWHLLRELAPRFIAGETVLVLQDFQYWLAYWVPMGISMVMRRCPGSLELVHVLPANTVTYRVTREIPARTIASFPPTIEEISEDVGIGLLAEMADRLVSDGEHTAAVITRLAGVAFLGSKGAWTRALELFRAVERDWPWMGESINQLAAARLWLADGAGVPLPASLRARRVERWARARAGFERRVGAGFVSRSTPPRRPF